MGFISKRNGNLHPNPVTQRKNNNGDNNNNDDDRKIFKQLLIPIVI